MIVRLEEVVRTDPGHETAGERQDPFPLRADHFLEKRLDFVVLAFAVHRELSE
jgi:hypothetical protein